MSSHPIRLYVLSHHIGLIEVDVHIHLGAAPAFAADAEAHHPAALHARMLFDSYPMVQGFTEPTAAHARPMNPTTTPTQNQQNLFTFYTN